MTMKTIDLDYAFTSKPSAFWLRFVLFALGLSILLVMLAWQRHLKAQLSAQQAIVEANVPRRASVNNSPQLQNALKFAAQTQQDLNFPWLQMLSALESVKAQHPHIQLLTINPNKVKFEVLLTGEAQTFEQMTAFLTSLKANASFGDAMLLNQHLIVENEKQAVPTYIFSMQLNWRI